MKSAQIIAALAIACLLSTTTAFASGHKAHWGYSGEEAPEHWGTLSHEYAMCGMGKNQSPINLTGMIEGELPALSVNYAAKGTEVINNGHAIQVNAAPGSSISIDGKTFELKQFHFHSPSENTIDGRSFPLEAHFVHVAANGELAVVALMFEEGAANAELEKAWAQMPAEAGAKAALEKVVDPATLLPANHDYYRFNGSLTTPPCSEGVNWFVIKAYASASQEQIEKFTHIMHHPNNRPVQPLNSRVVIQ